MIQIKQNKLVWMNNGEKIVVEAWGENSLRVRARRSPDILDTDFALLPPTETMVTVTEKDGVGMITNGGISAQVHISGWRKDRAQITFYNRRGEVLLQEIDDADSPYPYPHLFRSQGGDDYTLTCAFKSCDGEKFYGMGQYQQERLNIKGCMFELKQQNTQASIPFVYSSKGYGFLWHNPAIGQAVFANNRTIWTAESTKQLDYWITAGDTPADVLSGYMQATGLPPMMPEYGLGFWQSKARYWNQEQVLEIARGYKQRGVQLSVLVIDFFHWPRMGDFRFDEEFFPDPKAMVDELKAMGIETMVSVWTPVDYRSENFKEMRERNLLVQVERGVEITMRFFDGNTIYADMTNPETRQFVWGKLRDNYLKNSGIHLFWLDEAEPGYTKYDYDNYRYVQGAAQQIGNLYPLCYTRMVYEGLKNEGHDDIVNLVRCAWAGSQRYGALVWSGDVPSTWDALRMQLCAGQNMAMSGIPWWTTDIGGFHGARTDDPAFHELIIRWFQWGVFCPVMRLHGARMPQTDHYNKAGQLMLDEGAPNEIWSYGEEAEALMIRAIRLRESMRDYVRDLMRTAHENGTPLIRPVFLEFPEDACWELKDQYMFGGDVLVAPVTQPGMTSRKVYLPAGAHWTRLGESESIEGGRTITVDTPIDNIPVFLKNGTHATWHW